MAGLLGVDALEAAAADAVVVDGVVAGADDAAAEETGAESALEAVIALIGAIFNVHSGLGALYAIATSLVCFSKPTISISIFQTPSARSAND